MRTADELIDEVVASSQIPSGRRRQDVVRELRAHIEDFVLVARESGQTDDEIHRSVLTHFGDPQQIAQQFAAVYRRERAILRITVFLLSTLTVATAASAAILAMQAGVAAGFGLPVFDLLGSRHTIGIMLDTISTAAAYVGLLSLEKLFNTRRTLKAAAFMALIFAILISAVRAAGIRPQFLLFGFVCGVLLRTIPLLLNHRGAQVGAVLACFGAIGFSHRGSANPNDEMRIVTAWVANGAGYLLMTMLAARVDRAWVNRLQQD